ncbi:MAG: MFS transporter [Acidiferrobacter sp.]
MVGRRNPGLAAGAPMTPLERRAVAVLASIYGLRVFGLFLIMPVLAPYAAVLAPHMPLWGGLALGAYGLTQALLQIPSGRASDVFGRKPVMVVGLVVFAIGSLIAGFSHGIVGLVLGRAIQGAGAISAATMGLAADLTRDGQRTKAMALIGITIGAAFSVSLIVSPVLDGSIGVPGMFKLTAVLAVLAIGVLLWQVPRPDHPIHTEAPVALRDVIRDRHLLPLDFGIFFLQLVLTAMFVVLPETLIHTTGLPLDRQWEIYLPVVVVAFFTMGPFIHFGSRAPKPMLLVAVGALVLAELTYVVGYEAPVALVVGMWLFFTGFSLLESVLPSLISRLVPVQSRGAAIGVYSTFQFSGAFVGGVLGGAMAQYVGVEAVFIGSFIITLVWALVVIRTAPPPLLERRLVRLDHDPARSASIARELSALPGVAEVVLVADERTAYLQVDPQVFNEALVKPLTS